MNRLLVLFTVSAFGAFVCAAPVPRERVLPDDKAIKKRFYDCWHEEWREEYDAKGRVTVEQRPSLLSAYSFGEDGGWIWGWSGELSPASWYPMKLDTTRTPMRFDAIATDNDDKPRNVIPGVFKFDGARLILAYPYTNHGWRKWNATGEYADRPKDFDPRPGVVIAVMERCQYQEQYRPQERVPLP